MWIKLYSKYWLLAAQKSTNNDAINWQITLEYISTWSCEQMMTRNPRIFVRSWCDLVLAHFFGCTQFRPELLIIWRTVCWAEIQDWIKMDLIKYALIFAACVCLLKWNSLDLVWAKKNCSASYRFASYLDGFSFVFNISSVYLYAFSANFYAFYVLLLFLSCFFFYHLIHRIWFGFVIFFLMR